MKLLLISIVCLCSRLDTTEYKIYPSKYKRYIVSNNHIITLRYDKDGNKRIDVKLIDTNKINKTKIK